jgi:hypothetical protein
MSVQKNYEGLSRNRSAYISCLGDTAPLLRNQNDIHPPLVATSPQLLATSVRAPVVDYDDFLWQIRRRLNRIDSFDHRFAFVEHGNHNRYWKSTHVNPRESCAGNK